MAPVRKSGSQCASPVCVVYDCVACPSLCLSSLPYLHKKALGTRKRLAPRCRGKQRAWGRRSYQVVMPMLKPGKGSAPAPAPAPVTNTGSSPGFVKLDSWNLPSGASTSNMYILSYRVTMSHWSEARTCVFAMRSARSSAQQPKPQQGLRSQESACGIPQTRPTCETAGTGPSSGRKVATRG